MTTNSNKGDCASNAPTEGDSIRIKFILKDGVTVEHEFSPSDTIATATESLRSKWPEELNPTAPEADRIRLICMGKGVLGPLTHTLEEVEVPVFATHPTPVNVSVKPVMANSKYKHHKDSGNSARNNNSGGNSARNSSSGNNNSPPPGDCCCVIL